MTLGRREIRTDWHRSPHKEESRWLNDQKCLTEIFGSDYNYEILFSQNNSATEKTNVETLISKGAKIIVSLLLRRNCFCCGCQRRKEGRHHRHLLRPFDHGLDKLDYYVTFDSCSVGKAQAEYLIQQAGSEKGYQPLYVFSGALTDNNSVLFS